MKKVFCAVLFLLAVFAFSACANPPILKHYRVGQGFDVHYDGSVLIYEGKIDGKYDEDIILLYQADLNDEYKIIRWGDYKEHGNISAKVECVDGSRVVVVFKYLNNDYSSDNRTYYWDIPLDYTDETGSVKRVYLSIRTEQHENFGGGCSAGIFAPLALLLLLPLILKSNAT